MTASGCADSASAQAWAPPSASRTCQRRPVRCLGEPLAEAAVGAGHQRGARADAGGGRKGGNGNSDHDVSPVDRSN